MGNLYKVKYTQESEAFVQADSSREAVDYITELTENGGGSKMSSVRLNECGWFVEEDLGKFEKIENPDDQFETHQTEYRTYSEGDYGLFWD